jgi:hypothetical protein
VDSEEVTLQSFMQDSAWVRTYDGERTSRLVGVIMWIVFGPDRCYQPIANRDWESARHFDTRRFENVGQARRYAWQCFQEFLETRPPQTTTARPQS